MAWTLLLGIAVVAGLALVVLGLRGRRADDHPLCRRCGFDLFGNPAAAVCTECGADLTRPRAVKIGHRARRRGPLTLGLSLIAPALIVAAFLAVGVTRGIDWAEFWLRRQPTSWVVGRAIDESPTPAAVHRELIRRGDAGDLDRDAMRQLAGEALVRQPGSTTAAFASWAELFRRATGVGAVTDEQFARFLAQSFGPRLALSPRVRRGDPLQIRVLFEPNLAGWPTVAMRMPDCRLTLGGRELPSLLSDIGAFHGGTGGWVSSHGMFVDQPATGDPLPLGRQRVELQCPWVVVGWAAAGGTQHDLEPDAATALQTRLSLETFVEVLPADAPDPRLTGDNVHLPALRRAVTVSAVGRSTDSANPGRVMLRVGVVSPPVAVALVPELFWPGGTVRALAEGGRPPTRATSDAGETGQIVQDFQFELPEDVKRVDVVLRPSFASWENDSLAPLWTRPLVVPGVPVARDDWPGPPEHHPASALTPESPGTQSEPGNLGTLDR